MALVYDEAVFAKFKALSIQSEEEIEIGKTYYTNKYPFSFTVLGLETRSQNDLRHSFEVKEYENDKNEWMVTGPKEWDTRSMSDLNIGASYNPWLMFAKESDAEQCKTELSVGFTKDPFDDYLDHDYFDDYDNDLDVEDYEHPRHD